jgi:hypothetical protein
MQADFSAGPLARTLSHHGFHYYNPLTCVVDETHPDPARRPSPAGSNHLESALYHHPGCLTLPGAYGTMPTPIVKSFTGSV